MNGSAIGTDEVEKALAPQLNKLDEQIYNLKRQKIDGLINDKLLADEAKKRGISMPALVDAAVTSKVGLVTGQELENFYQANKAQVIAGQETQVREKMRACLQNQKIAQRSADVSGARARAAQSRRGSYGWFPTQPICTSQ